MSIDAQLREMQLIFIDEANQIITDAEETLLELESRGFDIDLVNKAFRLAHNFKGSARSVGFVELGELAHRYEDVLTALKNGKLALSPPVISGLLRCNDVLKREVALLKTKSDHVPTIQKDIRDLESIFSESSVADSHGTDWKKGWGIFGEEGLSEVAKLKKRQKLAPSGPVMASEKKDEGASDDTLKIPASRLDALLNVIGELVVNQSILDECRARGEFGHGVAEQSVTYMSKLIADIQNQSLSLRLVPIKPLFQKLRRTARDVAESLGKDIVIVEEGEFSELDKSIIERIADPLNHMVRNAVDHGVDGKEEREAAGKTPVATVRIAAHAQDEQVKIVVSDDGRGLNAERILKKAKDLGLVAPDATLSDSDIFQLIFAPGFSTKDQVTDVSGRGVGMEVVHKAVQGLKGTIRIESAIGKGTMFEISLPLSLSIIGGMIVSSGGQRFVVPVSQLVETIEITKHRSSIISGANQVLDLRGEVIPILNMKKLLNLKPGRSEKSTPEKNQPTHRPALISSYKGKKISFEVDEILTQQKVVLKKLGHEFDGLPGIVAGAVLSNGEPGLVLSLDKLAAGAES